MPAYKRPYSPPRKLERDLARVRALWQRLKRREAQMPFADDVNLSALGQLSGKVVLIEASEQPVRFRCGFELVGKEIAREFAGDLGGKFLDVVDVRHPLQFLLSQCGATVESAEPTYYRHGAAGRRGVRAQKKYSRLVLPLWGEGRIGMLLAAFHWG